MRERFRDGLLTGAILIFSLFIFMAAYSRTNTNVFRGGNLDSFPSYFSVVPCTDTSQNISFGIWTKDISLYNSGSDEVFVTGYSTIAYADLDAGFQSWCFPVYAGETLELNDYQVDHLAFKCNTGESTDLAVRAIQ